MRKERIRITGSGRVGFTVRVQPSARKNEVSGWNASGELRIRLSAPPVEGAANKSLLAFLASNFGLRKRDFAIESGEHSRIKSVSAPASIAPLLEAIPEE